MIEKRIHWSYNSALKLWCAYNMKTKYLGVLTKQRTGKFIHWCWWQDPDIYMSPGCLQEVRDKQKELHNK